MDRAVSDLVVRDLVKGFPGFQLGPIGLEITPGTACGLLGPNGAGKTTLLNCLAGQLTPDAGEMLWNGVRISRANWRLRESIAFVPEQPKLYDGLTVEQTLRFCSAVFQSWDREFVSEWLVKFGLPLKKRVRVLSKGLTVKLHLLIGLAHSARLLLLDEPTAGLDPESRVELREHIRALINDREVCALISSHLFQDIEAMATDFSIIRSGNLVFGSSLEEISDMRIYRRSGLGSVSPE
ncbi:MAG: ABC transporter ATP-binding protein [Acidobacteriota bacterium]